MVSNEASSKRLSMSENPLPTLPLQGLDLPLDADTREFVCKDTKNILIIFILLGKITKYLVV